MPPRFDSSRSGVRARLDAAFAREERRGLMLAAAARSAAVLVIIGWTAYSNPEQGRAFAWVLGSGSFFLVTGLAQLWLYARSNIVPSIAPYVFILVDSLALAAVVLAPNPFATVPLPPAMPLRFANVGFFFVLLMQMTFSFRPLLLLLWSTACGIGAWTLGFLWIVSGPGILLDPPGADMPTLLATYFAPNYVSRLKYQNEILVFLVVGTGLAVLVRRSRALVAERAEAERERGNLARYFSPKVVDVLAALDAWNRERAAASLPAMRMGLGLHYGQVVAGDIGSQRSMAFATVGDTTNVTSRLQGLTRISTPPSSSAARWWRPSSARTRTSRCSRG